MILSGLSLEISDREVGKTQNGRETENRKIRQRSLLKTQGGY